MFLVTFTIQILAWYVKMFICKGTEASAQPCQHLMERQAEIQFPCMRDSS